MKSRYRIISSLIILFLASVAGASEAKPIVYNHITPEGSRFDARIEEAYKHNYDVVNIGSDGYNRPTLAKGRLSRYFRLETDEFLEGYVAVAYIITLDGKTRDQIVVETSEERLNAPALAYAKTWRFHPARLHGVPAETLAIQEFRFRKPENGPVPDGVYMRELRILENQTILSEFDQQGPVLGGIDEVKLRLPAFVARTGEFAYRFEADLEATVTLIMVEDVTGRSPQLLFEDDNPRFERGRWMVVTPPVMLSKKTLPWIYERGDATRVYRFTIFTHSDAVPIILHQPVVWTSAFKRTLRRMEK